MHIPEGMPKPERSSFMVQVSRRIEVPVVVSRNEAAMPVISSCVSGSMRSCRVAVRRWG